MSARFLLMAQIIWVEYSKLIFESCMGFCVCLCLKPVNKPAFVQK